MFKKIFNWLKNYFNLNNRIKTEVNVEHCNVISQIIHPPENDEGMCACKDSCIETKNNSFIEYAQMIDDHHTNFVIGQCIKCDGVVGFPPNNLTMYLKNGKSPALEDLKKSYNITKEF